MGTTQAGIVVVMMTMRAAPDAAGTESQNTKEPHQDFGQP